MFAFYKYHKMINMIQIINILKNTAKHIFINMIDAIGFHNYESNVVLEPMKIKNFKNNFNPNTSK
jgi:hypothetical protein